VRRRCSAPTAQYAPAHLHWEVTLDHDIRNSEPTTGLEAVYHRGQVVNLDLDATVGHRLPGCAATTRCAQQVKVASR